MDTTGMPKTRAEAKRNGATHYFTGEPCKHGHVAPRKTKGACVECLRMEWRQSADKRADYFETYNKSAAGQEAKRAYYARNKNEVVARAAARPHAEKARHQKAWKVANPDWVLADNKVRRRKHRTATPPWVSPAQRIEMRRMYQMAIAMTKTTGERYVVDHIVPLRSEVVCGLHVPWNLRVITQEENLAKSNKHVL